MAGVEVRFRSVAASWVAGLSKHPGPDLQPSGGESTKPQTQSVPTASLITDKLNRQIQRGKRKADEKEKDYLKNKNQSRQQEDESEEESKVKSLKKVKVVRPTSSFYLTTEDIQSKLEDKTLSKTVRKHLKKRLNFLNQRRQDICQRRIDCKDLPVDTRLSKHSERNNTGEKEAGDTNTGRSPDLILKRMQPKTKLLELEVNNHKNVRSKSNVTVPTVRKQRRKRKLEK